MDICDASIKNSVNELIAYTRDADLHGCTAAQILLEFGHGRAAKCQTHLAVCCFQAVVLPVVKTLYLTIFVILPTRFAHTSRRASKAARFSHAIYRVLSSRQLFKFNLALSREVHLLLTYSYTSVVPGAKI